MEITKEGVWSLGGDADGALKPGAAERLDDLSDSASVSPEPPSSPCRSACWTNGGIPFFTFCSVGYLVCDMLVSLAFLSVARKKGKSHK